jgi:predicted N-acetyltransferase YhbS
MQIRLEAALDAAGIELLLDAAFGVDRFRKTSYRLREGVPPVIDLCLVAEGENAELLGTLRFWPVQIAGAERVLLLGPIAVLGDQCGNRDTPDDRRLGKGQSTGLAGGGAGR